jgi:Family of unknown function (DUF6152)
MIPVVDPIHLRDCILRGEEANEEACHSFCLHDMCVCSSALAHHSVSMYDMQHPTTVVGVVERVEWTNPHAYIYLKVSAVSGGASATGVDEEWAIEVDSPHFLKHTGWTSTTVKPGDTINCTGGRAKDGAKTMRCTIVKLSNGQELRS